MARKGLVIGSIIAGTAIGIGAGILLAPKSGKETRTELKQKCNKIIKNKKEKEEKENGK